MVLDMENATVGQGVAEAVRAGLARRRKSGTEMASVISVSQSSASRRLSGDIPFSIDELVLIAAWLGVDVIEFIPTSETGAA